MDGDEEAARSGPSSVSFPESAGLAKSSRYDGPSDNTATNCGSWSGVRNTGSDLGASD